MNTKEKILNESLKLFSKFGYDAVSVSQIAEAVGIKAPSLYKHYKSKREILKSIIDCVKKADEEYAKKYEMPESLCKNGEIVDIESIKSYTKAMFLHWTADEFFANFRRLLTIEQYKNEQLCELYRSCISDGPVRYMAEVLRDIVKDDKNLYDAALEFYAPMYFLYSAYDAGMDNKSALDILNSHMERFFEALKK